MNQENNAKESTQKLIQNYYNSFNTQNVAAMKSCLHQDFLHDVNEGETKKGLDYFDKFMDHMNTCYKEDLKDIQIMVHDSGHKAAAEFVVHGTYLKTDGSLPEAKGQKYVIKAGTFFEIKDQKIVRVTTYYNLNDWIKQVSQ